MRSSPTRWRARSERPPHARASWPQRVRTDPTDAEELMSAITFVVETLLSLALFVVLARLLLQWTRADFRNPLCQAVVRITNPLILPLRRVLPPIGKLDTASVVAVLLIATVDVACIFALHALGFPPPLLWVRPVLTEIARTLLWTYLSAIFLYALLSLIAPAATRRCSRCSRRCASRCCGRSDG